jgi:hypothetical protein
MGEKFGTFFAGAYDIQPENHRVCDVLLPICSCNLLINGALNNGFCITGIIKSVYKLPS